MKTLQPCSFAVEILRISLRGAGMPMQFRRRRGLLYNFFRSSFSKDRPNKTNDLHRSCKMDAILKINFSAAFSELIQNSLGHFTTLLTLFSTLHATPLNTIPCIFSRFKCVVITCQRITPIYFSNVDPVDKNKFWNAIS